MRHVKIDWSQRVREADEEALRQANAARRTLAETDWYVIRQTETGQPIPASIAAARAEARKKAGRDPAGDQPAPVLSPVLSPVLREAKAALPPADQTDR